MRHYIDKEDNHPKYAMYKEISKEPLPDIIKESCLGKKPAQNDSETLSKAVCLEHLRDYEYFR